MKAYPKLSAAATGAIAGRCVTAGQLPAMVVEEISIFGIRTR
jgi:hypothetical protein